MASMHVTASPFGTPIEVPGLGALNSGGDAAANSISCVAPGECAATGNYSGAHTRTQGFVVSETKGHWGKAIAIPGLAALMGSTGDLFEVSIACGSKGNCVLGGDGTFAFVASEVNGKWGKAIRVPGLAGLDKRRSEELTAVSCAHGGNDCTAGGGYLTISNLRPFVVRERNGHWGKAITVPGLGPTQNGRIQTLACPSAGNCSAGTGPGDDAFVVTEKNGTWGKLIEVPGLSALTVSDPEIDEIACASAGNCSAGVNTTGDEVFVVTEKNGKWGNAIELPGPSNWDTQGFITLDAIACTAPGGCVASGNYTDTGQAVQGWVATEKNGTWGNAIEIPGLAALNKFHNVGVARVACAATGSCVAFGNYQSGPGDDNPKITAFIASETKGVWGNATQLPGLNKLAFRSSSVHAMSCPSLGHCSASGFYQDKNEANQAFVVDQK
jgi:hypothetical protein